MTLRTLVDGYAREYGMTQREIASALGMSERTYRRRLALPDAFTVGEVRVLMELLNIPTEELRYTL